MAPAGTVPEHAARPAALMLPRAVTARPPARKVQVTLPPAAGSPGAPNVTSRTNRAARNVPPAAGRAGDRLDDRISSLVGSFSS